MQYKDDYKIVRAVFVALVVLAGLPSAAALAPGPAKMLTEPALSIDRIAFVYGNDIWTCRRDGTGVQRMTSGPGLKTSPGFSPDGSLLAFSAELDGNLGVYVVPAAGGVPKRLAWHPGRDVVQGFTPDGKAVLFTSPRAATNNRHQQLYTVGIEGGIETALPIPYANKAVISPDGKTIAYTPNSPPFLQWKRYRGGLVSRIYLYDVASQAVEKVPQPEARCNDVQPMWVDGNRVFRSDRGGEFNLYAFDPRTKALMKLTTHVDFPILNAGASVGEIVSVPAQKGDPRNLTYTTGVQGPRVIIIDETAGSGGDLLPWMFHKFKLGPLVGQRTWGGLVGILGFAVLMDGGMVTAPNPACWTREEGFIIENVGVPPDVDVEQTPSEVFARKDPSSKNRSRLRWTS